MRGSFSHGLTSPTLNTVLPDDFKVIHGQGMPSQRHHDYGDLYVKFTISWPDHIPVEHIPLLERALPPRKGVEAFSQDTIVDEVELENVDPRQRDRAQRDEPMEEDEGEPRVQCANQ